MYNNITQNIKHIYLTFLAGGSHAHFCEVQESLAEHCRASTAFTTQDNRAAMWEHASPRLNVEHNGGSKVAYFFSAYPAMQVQ